MRTATRIVVGALIVLTACNEAATGPGIDRGQAEARPDVETTDCEDADLTALIEGCPAARLLLARIVTAWCERIAREI